MTGSPTIFSRRHLSPFFTDSHCIPRSTFILNKDCDKKGQDKSTFNFDRLKRFLVEFLSGGG